jgi:hypothetical protein
MLKLLRSVRKAIKLWQSLPAEERDLHKARVNRIRSLVAELGGQRALAYVDREDDVEHAQFDKEGTPTDRSRTQVLTDLQNETTGLLVALAPPTTALAKESVPKSARLSGKIASKGISFAARRLSRQPRDQAADSRSAGLRARARA